MKHKVKKLVALSTVIAAGLLTSNPVLAENDPDIVYPITTGVASAFGFGTINILSGLYTYLQACENAYSTWVMNTMKENATQYAIANSQKVQAQTAKQTTAFIFSAITPSQGAAPIQGLPAVYPPGIFASMVPIKRDSAGLSKSTYLSSESLLSTTKFNGDNQRRQAGVFIQFLGDAGDKVPPLSSQSLTNANRTVVASYLNSMGNYYAGQSIGLNALFNLYNERIPVPQLNNESVLSLDQKQVMRRLQPAWTESVSKMTIVDVARETLYTQAEMNYQLFQLRMQLEQLNATLATMQLEQQQSAEKNTLLEKEELVVKSASAATNTSG